MTRAFEGVATPCYICDERLLRKNLEVLRGIQDDTGCKILLALKAFSQFSTFPLVREYLCGVCASSPHEARLGREEFGGEVHVHAPALSDQELDEVLELADHITFNSLAQWARAGERLPALPTPPECGLRVNPEYSEVEVELYNPCARYSRLGIRRADLEGQSLEGISGLHFHTMCEQNADTLERTVAVFSEKFGDLLESVRWVNFGGGHHITRADYDVKKLCRVVKAFSDQYGVQVYLEPGEAVALGTGVLVGSVLDIVRNEMDIALLDVSATAHMPDVLEMPYRPVVTGAGEPGQKPHTYRLAGPTCLAGDVIGDYAFDQPLRVGQRIAFEDMAHYTMVKNTTFNGVRLPSIAIRREGDQRVDVVRRFGYEDFRSRLS